VLRIKGWRLRYRHTLFGSTLTPIMSLFRQAMRAVANQSGFQLRHAGADISPSLSLPQGVATRSSASYSSCAAGEDPVEADGSMCWSIGPASLHTHRLGASVNLRQFFSFVFFCLVGKAPHGFLSDGGKHLVVTFATTHPRCYVSVQVPSAFRDIRRVL
jgi:hypothetical protein